ncbi:Tetratricopeptide repeat protein 1 [Phytophthora citrophthora]|uniref:Tetratricopeptide repeat protein 1 n=1 Tax=Phytophthora citrophthora TaxID=4793 RepID=A0AAD9G9G8_9STRA|nr:Tetratricopeptide repeat protein 1 [Phytophthora citrophthora]
MAFLNSFDKMADSESRFEVLEEETHYPSTHPKSIEKQAEDKPEESLEEKEEETLEQQLEKLVLSVKKNDTDEEEEDASKDNTDVVKKASSAKELGNKFFSRGSYLDAIECYTTALKLCPTEEEYSYNRAVYFSNRAACLLRLGRTEESVDDCTQAVTLSPTYVKALLRRAEALEKLDKLEEALADYDAVLKIDPTVRTAVKGHERLQKIVHERQEKMKAEMMDKLKGFGNTILGKFGLSTDNFQMVQDPATGSLSQELVDVAAQHASFAAQVHQAFQCPDTTEGSHLDIPEGESVSGAAPFDRSGTVTEGHFAWEPYESKTQDLIRKECSLREIKLHTRTNKADRIKCLRRYDDLVNQGEHTSEASTLATGSTRCTKHCVFRLINVLMSNDFVMRLIEVTGKNFDRQDLDDVQGSQKAQFWKDVETKFCSNDKDCNELIEDDVAFEGINPSIVVKHNAAKLEEIWAEVRSFFSIYEANFRMSGTHSRHFKKFVRRHADVLYLWYWLKLRPDALINVRGGLYVEDEFDTMAASETPTREVRSPYNSTPTGPGTNKKRAGSCTSHTKKPNKKTKSDSGSMEILLMMVGRIAAAREAEVVQAMELDHEAAARTRAENYKMLDGIRKRTSTIEAK